VHLFTLSIVLFAKGREKCCTTQAGVGGLPDPADADRREGATGQQHQLCSSLSFASSAFAGIKICLESFVQVNPLKHWSGISHMPQWRSSGGV
jgi:hypothetical protein